MTVIKSLVMGTLLITMLFGGLFYFLAQNGAMSFTLLPTMNQEQAKDDEWVFELNDGSRWSRK